MDELIARLRERAADPERRTQVRPTLFTRHVRGLDARELLTSLEQTRAHLDRAVAASLAGRIDPAAGGRADELAAALQTPAPSSLPPPLDAEMLRRAETALGVPLPPFLRRVYTEVSDGGFGPGTGLLAMAQVAARYGELRSGDELPRGRAWPEGLLPLVERDPGWDCVEASSGRIVEWDPEGLSERSSEAAFRRSFSEVAPSAEAWLEQWLTARTFEERLAEQVAAANLQAAREARARIAAKTPEERAQMGLPEVGWERIVWGGLGLDEEGS